MWPPSPCSPCSLLHIIMDCRNRITHWEISGGGQKKVDKKKMPLLFYAHAYVLAADLWKQLITFFSKYLIWSYFYNLLSVSQINVLSHKTSVLSFANLYLPLTITLTINLCFLKTINTWCACAERCCWINSRFRPCKYTSDEMQWSNWPCMQDDSGEPGFVCIEYIVLW